MDIPAALHLKVGETYALRLKNLASAGYTWNYSIKGDEHAASVSQAVPDNSPEIASVGSFNGDQEYVIRGQEQGNFLLYFALRRSWEKDKPPAQAFTIEVHVELAVSE